MGNLTYTVGGTDNLVNFKSAARVPIENLKCHFAPIQDGEGDPSPENVRPIRGWNGVEVERCGKNLLPSGTYTKEVKDQGILLEYNDGALHIKSEGTGTSQCAFLGLPDSFLKHIPKGTYTLSGGTNKYGSGYITIYLLVNNKDIEFKILNANPVTKILEDSNIKLQVAVKTNLAMDITLYPQLEIGSVATEYEPYCGEVIPVTFPVTGKNVLDITKNNQLTSLNYTFSAGAINCIKVSASNASYVRFEQIFPAGTYTISCDYSGDGTVGPRFVCSKPIDGGTWNDYYQGYWKEFTERSCTFTAEEPFSPALVFLKRSDHYEESGTFYNIQLEFGSEATAYETYNPDNTIYGGYVDLTKGEVVAEYGHYTFFGSEKDSFTYTDTASRIGNVERHYFNTKILDRLPVNSSSSLAYANIAVPTSTKSGDFLFYIGTPTNQILICIKSSMCEPTVESFNAWLSEHPLQLVYKLKDPVHYPLTTAQLQTFLGNNAFWSNTNDVTEVSYAVHDIAPIRATKKRIMMASPHLETASSDLVTFNTDVAAPLKECKVYFEPVQEGEGDPSPDNIRPITGWNNIEVTKCGKNLFDISVMKSRPNITVEDDTFIGSPFNMYNYKKTELLHIPKNTSINVSCTAYNDGQYGTGGSGFSPWFYYKNGNNICPWYTSNYLLNPTTYSGSIVFESDVVNYLFGYYNYSNNIWHVSNMQFEIGSSMTEYEPYSGTTIQITFPTEAGTVYGGYVDLIKGKLIVNYVVEEPNENKFGFVNNYSYQWGHAKCATDTPVDYKKAICSHWLSTRWDNGNMLKLNANGAFWIGKEFYDAVGIEFTNEAIHNYIAEQKAKGTPLQAGGPLVTPLEYDIDPQTLKTLRGTNNIWSTSNGPITIKYWKH